MSSESSDPARTAFAHDVLEGLSKPQKAISSRYFYDAEGDRLFQAIMESPEYYLTRCEYEIFSHQGDAIAEELRGLNIDEIVELGSGDGLKSGLLLDAFHTAGMEPRYRPVDISSNSLDLLRENLKPGRPWLDFRPVHANYHDFLKSQSAGSARRLMLYLGSNLGNFTGGREIDFLRSIRKTLTPEDRFLIGLDLKKDPAVIRAAYNDAGGQTAQFNLNLLRRINRELGGTFVISQFEHHPVYDAERGAALSYLRSKQQQSVRIETLNRSFEFSAGETIFTEISQKYDRPLIDEMTSATQFQPLTSFEDEKGWFSDQLWKPVA